MLSAIDWQEPVDFQIAFLGQILDQPKLPMHVGWGPWHKTRVVLTYIWPEA